MLNYLISVSHSDFDRFRSNMEKVVEICSISGFSGIEGNHRLFYGLDRKHLEKAGEIFSDSRIKIPTFHLPCSQDPDLDLVNPDREYREKAVVIYREWIEKAALLGAGKAVIHGTTLFSGSPETDIEVLVDRFAESFEPVLESAVKNRIVLALENHNPSVKGRFCSETDHFKRILERFDSPLSCSVLTSDMHISDTGTCMMNCLISWRKKLPLSTFTTIQGGMIFTCLPDTVIWTGKRSEDC